MRPILPAFYVACALTLGSAPTTAQNPPSSEQVSSVMTDRIRSMFKPEPTQTTHHRAVPGQWDRFLFGRMMQENIDVSLDLETACQNALAQTSALKDGSFMIHHYIVAFNSIFPGRGTTENWEKTFTKIKAWRITHPKSKCAPLVEAKYWRSYAWAARGTGYSHSVQKEGWELFGERMQKSYAVAMEAKTLAASNPVWFSTVIPAALDLQLPGSEIYSLVAQSLKQYPDYWEPSFIVSGRLIPKWGSSWQQHEAFTRSVSQLVEPAKRDEIYATHYWNVLESGELEGFSAMNWPRLKSGMKILIAKIPEDNRYVNAYAVFACAVHDSEAYSFARIQILANRLTPAIWQRGMSMEICDRRFKLDKPL